MNLKISDWLDKEGTSIDKKEFFLGKDEYSSLYANANMRYEAYRQGTSDNPSYEPVEQLSPKGLSLLSFIYSQKDDNQVQPVIASTRDEFRHMITLVANSPPGTKVTVIFQATDAIDSAFSPGKIHKTVCKLERDESGVNVINMDSASGQSQVLCYLLVQRTLKDTGIPFKFYKQEEDNLTAPSSGSQSRQKDEYQCGVFAFKDARQLSRDNDFLTKIQFHQRDEENFDYRLPTEYLKSIQSRKFSKQVLDEHGDEVVTRKGKTLRQVHEEHQVAGYIQHFSQKHHHLITKYLDDNQDNPERIRECVSQYDASTMTLNRLIEIYGPLRIVETQSIESISDSVDPSIIVVNPPLEPEAGLVSLSQEQLQLEKSTVRPSPINNLDATTERPRIEQESVEISIDTDEAVVYDKLSLPTSSMGLSFASEEQSPSDLHGSILKTGASIIQTTIIGKEKVSTDTSENEGATEIMIQTIQEFTLVSEQYLIKLGNDLTKYVKHDSADKSIPDYSEPASIDKLDHSAWEKYNLVKEALQQLTDPTKLYSDRMKAFNAIMIDDKNVDTLSKRRDSLLVGIAKIAFTLGAILVYRWAMNYQVTEDARNAKFFVEKYKELLQSEKSDALKKETGPDDSNQSSPMS